MLKARCFVLGLCLMVLMSFLSPVSVMAVSVDAVQGVIGSTVTVRELPVGQTYLILWDSVSHESGVVPATGIITFTVPESVGGIHTFVIQSPQGGASVLSSNFIVLPSISISPETGTAGTTVTVNGKGFTASESSISILYDSTSVKSSIVATSTGTWTSTFAIPSSTAGSHTIDAYGVITLATSVADKTFTVKPGITVSPTSGGVGTTVTVTGTAFPGSETGITVYFDSTTIRSNLTADSTGSWSTSFAVPSTYSGNHLVDVYSATISANNIADVTFAVVSGFSIDKTSVYIGDAVTITGSGFSVGETNIYITYDGINQGSGTTADTTGQWKASLTVPASVSGTHTIGAIGSSTKIDSGKAITVMARIIVNPPSGNVGDTVAITGTGFTGSKAMSVMFGSVSVLSNVNTDATGGFTGTFKAPKGMNGDIKVTATDANAITANAVFAMDKTIPSIPQPLSPLRDSTVGYVGDIKVNFRWGGVTDPSGVTYDIQVADDVSFKNMRLQYSNLSVTEYKTTDSEALPQGQYYWRVRAVDGANNASDWTSAIQFNAGYMSTTTMIIIIVVLVVILFILLRIRAVFGKR